MLTEDQINRFGGVGRLYGIEGLERLLNSHVMVVGLGGVGSWAVESLARTGVGKLTLVDLDDICITNTNRQLPAHEENYGKMKAEALAERIKLINPDCEVNIELTFYSPRSADHLFSTYPDIVIDAIDSVNAKCHLLSECRQRKIHAISSGGAGGRKDATMIKVDDITVTLGDRLSSRVCKKLRKEYDFPKGHPVKSEEFNIPTVFSIEPKTDPQPCSIDGEEPPPLVGPRNLNCATGFGAIAHVTATFGMIMAQLALEKLLEK